MWCYIMLLTPQIMTAKNLEYKISHIMYAIVSSSKTHLLLYEIFV